MMNEQQLLRYSRQIMLPEVDIAGQAVLLKRTAVIVGLGGLGSISAMYLASSGIGHLILVDFDIVELSNLQRQIIHFHRDMGRLKVDSAAETLALLNHEVKVSTLANVDEKSLFDVIKKADIVLDGTDNFKSRFLINQLTVRAKKPLVSAAVIRFEGQLAVFKGWLKNEPCYQCLYPLGGDDDSNCVNNGVLAPMAGMIGTMQAMQTIKVLLNLSEQLLGRLLLVDGLAMQFRQLKIEKDKACSVCYPASQ